MVNEVNPSLVASPGLLPRGTADKVDAEKQLTVSLALIKKTKFDKTRKCKRNVLFFVRRSVQSRRQAIRIVPSGIMKHHGRRDRCRNCRRQHVSRRRQDSERNSRRSRYLTRQADEGGEVFEVHSGLRCHQRTRRASLRTSSTRFGHSSAIMPKAASLQKHLSYTVTL